MKVLVLGCKDYPAFSTPWVHSGGMEVYVERLVRSLSGRAAFTLYAAAGRSDADAAVVALGARRGLRTQPLSLALRSWRRLRTEPERFDVLNPQTPLAALAARWLRRTRGTPYVVGVHIFGADPAHAGGRLAATLYGRVEKLVFSDASGIIPTGHNLAKVLGARHPEVRSRISVVTAAGVGVQAAADAGATRSRLGLGAEDPVLLFLGRLVSENAVDELLAAVALLRRRLPAVRLLIAGSGTARDEAAVDGRIAALGLGSAVLRVGRVTGQEKLDLLAAADVMVRTSRHEVFPEAYLESLSVGTPVAATGAGDTAELAAESGAVRLLPFGDPAGQAEILGELLEDVPGRRAMRAAALDYSARSTWTRNRERYWEVLASAASAGSAAS